MARGRPLLWGAVLGIPALVGGGYILQTESGPLAGFGYAFMALGVLSLLIGLYVRVVSPEPLDLDDAEVFGPSQLAAYLYFAFSVVFAVLTVYLLYGTRVPYMWPTLTFLVFVGTFAKAGVTYWRNTLTTYYITPDGIVSEYRFISLERSSLNHGDVTNIARKQSAFETLTGLGSVKVTVAGSEMILRNLVRPEEAEKILRRCAN